MTYYTVDVPFGYASLPFRESNVSGHDRSSSFRNSRSTTPRNTTPTVSNILPFVSSSDNLKMLNSGAKVYSCVQDNVVDRASYIDKLPFEVRLKIANELSQYDSLYLLLVNKSFFISTISRLYHTIIIDPKYSQFNLGIYAKQSPSPLTFVKLSYSLKNLIRIIDRPILKGNDCENNNTMENCTYGSLVNKIQFIELPDGFNSIVDISTFFNSESVLQKLSHLNKFYWGANDGLSIDFLDTFPNKSHIKSAHLCLDFRSTTKEIDFKSFKGFDNLHKLSIEPFQNSLNLFHIFKNLLDSNNDRRYWDLNTLRLSRVNSSFSFIKNPTNSLYVITNYNLEHDAVSLTDFDTDTILNLFIAFTGSDKSLDDLEVLSLDSIIVQTIDVKRLDSFINLSKLNHLELKNTTELQILDDVFINLSTDQLYDHLDSGFLRSLNRKLSSNLTKLSIEFKESLRDTVPSFIANLNGGLQELDLVIRWNASKLCTVSSWKQLCMIYIRSILKHSNTLKKLSLDTKEDSIFSDSHKPICQECLLELVNLKQLEALRLNGYSLHPFAPILANALPNLKYFEIFGPGSGGAPHMGLQVVHFGVLDEWLKVQHVALAILDRNENIQFIKVDKCLFEIKDKASAVPRNGLEKWFENKVRVVIGSDDF